MGKKQRNRSEEKTTRAEVRTPARSDWKKTVGVLALFAVAVTGIIGTTVWMVRGRNATAAVGAASAKGFCTITPQEAKTLIETRSDLLVVDVRSPEEYAGGALPGSTLLPFWEFTKGIPDLPKDKPLLLVCAVGGRSYGVGRLLAAQGYPEVYNLKGGLSAWIEQRVPLPARR